MQRDHYAITSKDRAPIQAPGTTSRHCWAVVFLFQLAGCAAYPGLYTAPPTSTTSSGAYRSGVERVAEDAHRSQQVFENAYAQSARVSDWANLPLVGAAAGAAAALYFGAHTDVLASIGIGAGTYVAGRSLLYPTELPKLYIEAHAAVGCLRAETLLFAGPRAVDARNAFAGRVQAFSDHIADAERLYRGAQLSANASADTRELFKSGITSLVQATNLASQTLNAAYKDLAAYDSAESAFGTALTAVHTRVASKSRVGRTVDFAQLQSTITGGIQGLVSQQTPQTASASGDHSRAAARSLTAGLNDLQIVETVVFTAAKLNQESQAISSVSPKYADALVRVAACPNKIT